MTSPASSDSAQSNATSPNANQPDVSQAEDAARLAGLRFKYAGNPDHPLMALLLSRATQAATQLQATRPDKVAALLERFTSPAKELDVEPRRTSPVEFLQGNVKLPSLPTLLAELQEVINDPNAGSEKLAAVISKDTGLAAMLLRIVNSAFYSFSSQVETISRAVTVVGTQQLSMLATGGAVTGMFSELPDETIDIADFWKHSIAVGLIAREMAKAGGIRDAERYFVAGLLHDIGRLALFNADPAIGKDVIRVAHGSHELLMDAEEHVVGFTHATFGSMLLRKWNLPMPLVMAVLHHHSPSKAHTHPEPAYVHVADICAKSMGYASTGESYVPPMDMDAWERIGLSVEQLGAILDTLDDELVPTVKLFIPDAA